MMTVVLIESGIGSPRSSSLFNRLCRGAIRRLTLVANNEQTINPQVNLCSPIVLLPRFCVSAFPRFPILYFCLLMEVNGSLERLQVVHSTYNILVQ